jgi:23S rRNA (guanosine2251-2'-O)-methyltransferase
MSNRGPGDRPSGERKTPMARSSSGRPSSTRTSTRSSEGSARPTEGKRASSADKIYSGKAERPSAGKPIRGRTGTGRQSPEKGASITPHHYHSYQTVAKPARPMEAPKEMDFLSGRNPVMEALRSGRPISKIFIAAGEHQGSIREIIALAKEKGIPVQTAEVAKMEAMSLGVRNQGVVAMVSPVAYSSVEEMTALAAARNESPCLVLLDQLKDPQNLGAVLRTVDAAGAHGVLIPQRRSCQLSAAVAKASAGAIEYVKVAQIGNVAQTLEDLKKQGFWVIGADPEQGISYHDVDLTRPIVIVIGDEGEGMARLTKERCDSLVQIPMRGKVQSLNASVASAIILYEMIRQRSTVGSP